LSGNSVAAALQSGMENLPYFPDKN